MKTNINLAAKELLKSIGAPAGAVNTSIDVRKGKVRICVFVLPQYKYQLMSLPRTFRGYPVSIEVRQSALAEA